MMNDVYLAVFSPPSGSLNVAVPQPDLGIDKVSVSKSSTPTVWGENFWCREIRKTWLKLKQLHVLVYKVLIVPLGPDQMLQNLLKGKCPELSTFVFHWQNKISGGSFQVYKVEALSNGSSTGCRKKWVCIDCNGKIRQFLHEFMVLISSLSIMKNQCSILIGHIVGDL